MILLPKSAVLQATGAKPRGAGGRRVCDIGGSGVDLNSGYEFQSCELSLALTSPLSFCLILEPLSILSVESILLVSVLISLNLFSQYTVQPWGCGNSVLRFGPRVVVTSGQLESSL